MPIITTQYLLAVREYLKSKSRANTATDALRWVRRLQRPLYMGRGVV